MERLATTVFAGVLLLATAGCAPFQQYRTDYQLCDNPAPDLSSECAAHALQQFPVADGSRYLLGFVEFDDQGQIWDRRQMGAVIDRLNVEAADKDLLMVVFAHGWKHSAAPGDGNIETFHKVLARLAADENNISRQTGLTARQVVGVYLGWRGASLTVPYLDNITFWDRKNTAQAVGHGGVTEVLSRIELVKRDKDSSVPGGSATRLAIIGHSFGGAAVYTSLAQILQGRFVRTKGPAGVQGDVEGFGNIVVLINPAFEASLYAPLSDMSTERGRYFASQLPVMAILTSEADYATRYAFPAGRFFSTLLEKDRDMQRWNAVTRRQETVDEGKANTQAVGHFEPYRTHKLYPAAPVPREQVALQSSGESARAVARASVDWEHEGPGSVLDIGGLTLERTDRSAGRNPYLVVRVDRQLIKDHNDIDDPRIIDFIKQLILVSAQSPERKDVLQRSLGEPVPAR